MKRANFSFFKPGGNRTGFSLLGILIALTVAVPGWAVTITTCGFNITAPGNYIVGADLNCPTGDGIDINASQVGLNLNGHRIIGSTSSFPLSAGVNVNTAGGSVRLTQVSITGSGLVQSFFNGINITNCDYCQVDLVTASQNGDGLFAAGVNFLSVLSNVFVANLGAGMIVGHSVNGTLSQNELSGNGTDGLALEANGGASVANLVNNNRAVGDLYNGIYISANSSRLYGNTTNGNQKAGILVDTGSTGNQVFNNSSAGNVGFDLQDANPSCGSDTWGGNVFFNSNPSSCVH